MKLKIGMKQLACLLTVIALAVIFLPSNTPVTAATVDVSSPWIAFESYKGCATYGVDKSQKYGNSAYSIRITNTGYNYATVKKEVTLKPNTAYRYSAMVKYSGYELEPGATGGAGGSIGVLIGTSWNVTGYNNTGEWVRISYNFRTDDTGKATLYLRNGYPYCKGTAYYSDIRLEEVVKDTNQWNILILIVKNIDADVVVSGNSSHYKGSFSDDDIKFLKKNLPAELTKQLPKVSDGLIGVDKSDVYVVKTPITELKLSNNSIDPYTNSTIKKEIDKYTSKQTYQQIILVDPFKSGITSWVGLGGYKYNGINLCQNMHTPGERSFDNRKSYAKYTVSGYIHEILHGVEGDSKAIDGDKIPDFHENIGIYKEYYTDEKDGWFSYHHDYITCNLPDGRGINQSVLYRPSVYLLISDDMTVGSGISVSGTLPKHISKLVSVGKTTDVYYTGKAVKPDVKIKGGKKGKDYKITYSDNKSAGTGKVIIKGTGKYYGSIEKDFEIKLKKTTLKISGKSLKWSKVSGADGYEIYYSKNGGKYKKLTDLTKTSYSIAKLTGGTYKFKVRAFSRTNSGLVTGSWSNVKGYN